MQIDWRTFLIPIFEAILNAGIKLIYELVEKWAAGRENKPTSTEKKEKAKELARALQVPLDEDQLDAAIEVVHEVTLSQKRQEKRVGKTAAA